ncbi:MAG: hypothetical protein MJY82_07020 [Fibrobacter sp.]|nr:hypothetical protein [Fibrobacter sp.]
MGIVGRLAVAFSLSVSFVLAAPVVDSRDNHSYKTISNGKLNWFTDNLKFAEQASFADKSKNQFYTSDAWEGACPEGTHLPDVLEWNDIYKARFTGPRKKPNVKSFAGKTRGYYLMNDSKKSIKGKDAAYFAIAGAGDKAMMLDIKRGIAKPVSIVKDAAVNIRCVAERDLYAEKNVSQKDMILTDSRDGKKYSVEQKGEKLWMTANLKFSLQNVKQCLLEDTLFCQKHGRFYTYSEAKRACPAGWRLPDDSDWRDYQRDQSKLDWENIGVGGCKDWDGYCDGGSTGHYWSATSITKNTGRAWEFRRLGKSINRTDENTQKGLYVRCIASLE